MLPLIEVKIDPYENDIVPAEMKGVARWALK